MYSRSWMDSSLITIVIRLSGNFSKWANAVSFLELTARYTRDQKSLKKKKIKKTTLFKIAFKASGSKYMKRKYATH